MAIDRAAGGLGLGLMLVRNLVELHGGAVTAVSAGAGRGSEFTVRLPALAPAAGDGANSSEPLEVPTTSSRGERVLVVDDNRDAAEMLGEALRSLGYEVQVAGDGPSALRLAAQALPAIALVDIGLPVMDGYELARRLHEQVSSQIRIIAITGYGQESDRWRAKQEGFEAHFVKPVDLGILSRLLRGE